MSGRGREGVSGPSGPAGLESTTTLLGLVRSGDLAARDRLVRRFLPTLQRWARGRLPGRARSLLDTDDLVQVTFLRALDHVEGFEPQGRGSFLAYLRRILQNAIHDHVRAVTRRPQAVDLPESMAGEEPSPLERAIGREKLARYEQALAKLTPAQQEAVVLRIELGLTHAEVAESMGLASANAARMQVSRALVRLAEAIDER